MIFKLVLLPSLKKNCNMFRLLLVFVLLIISTAIFGSQPTDPRLRIEEINRLIKEQMLRRNELIEKEQYGKAERSTAQIIDELDRLIEAVMPLDERIAMLLNREREIVEQTRQLGNQSAGSGSKKTGSGPDDDLIHKQILNREKTEQTFRLVERELNQKSEFPVPTDERSNSQNPSSQLDEVSGLVKAAASDQTNAIADLELSRHQLAIQDEEAAVEKLESALTKLRQQKPGKQNVRQNKSDSRKQQSQDNQQDQSTVPQQQQVKKQGDADSKKLTPREALKELLKLRKQAADEKKRREKEYGGTMLEGRVPVEKDW